LVGNDSPIFFIRDPILFPSFSHATKRNPVTNIHVRIILGFQLQNIHFLKQNVIESPFFYFPFVVPEMLMVLQAHVLLKINHATYIKLEIIRNYLALYLLYMLPSPQYRKTQDPVQCALHVKQLGLGLENPPTSSVEVKESV
jgi:hypothetical protein